MQTVFGGCYPVSVLCEVVINFWLIRSENSLVCQSTCFEDKLRFMAWLECCLERLYHCHLSWEGFWPNSLGQRTPIHFIVNVQLHCIIFSIIQSTIQYKQLHDTDLLGHIGLPVCPKSAEYFHPVIKCRGRQHRFQYGQQVGDFRGVQGSMLPTNCVHYCSPE